MWKRELPTLLQQLGISLPSGFLEGSKEVQMMLGPLEPTEASVTSTAKETTLTPVEPVPPVTSPDVTEAVKSAPEPSTTPPAVQSPSEQFFKHFRK